MTKKANQNKRKEKGGGLQKEGGMTKRGKMKWLKVFYC